MTPRSHPGAPRPLPSGTPAQLTTLSGPADPGGDKVQFYLKSHHYSPRGWGMASFTSENWVQAEKCTGGWGRFGGSGHTQGPLVVVSIKHQPLPRPLPCPAPPPGAQAATFFSLRPEPDSSASNKMFLESSGSRISTLGVCKEMDFGDKGKIVVLRESSSSCSQACRFKE